MYIPYEIARRDPETLERMENATEIFYYVKSEELYFSALEAAFLVCRYAESVSGSREAVAAYYEKRLQEAFPRAAVRVYTNK